VTGSRQDLGQLTSAAIVGVMTDPRTPPERPVPVTRLLPLSAQVALVSGVARRPQLWATALRQLWAVRDHRWWRRPPFLPLPPGDYARFRLQTMYGGSGRLPDDVAVHAAADIIRWLGWARREARLATGRA